MPAELKYLVNYKNSLSHMNTFRGKNFQNVEIDMRTNYGGRWSKNFEKSKHFFYQVIFNRNIDKKLGNIFFGMKIFFLLTYLIKSI